MSLKIQNTLEKALQKAKSLGADQCEAIFTEGQETSVLYRMGEKEINSSKTQGVGIRIIKDNKQACVSTSNLDQVGSSVEKAMSLIQHLPSNKYHSLPPPESYSKNYDAILKDLDLLDTKSVSLANLLEKAKTCEEIALSQAGISNSEGAECSQSFGTRHMMNSSGFAAQYSSSLSSLSCCVVAESSGKMERDYHYSQARYFEDLEGEEKLALEAAQNALMRLNPKKIPSTQCGAVFDKRVAKSLLQDVAEAINGASLVRAQTFLSGKLDKNIFSKNVQITNDPHIKKGIGSTPFDHEGVANSRNEIVKDGRLKSYILDWTTSQEMEMKNTANGKRSLAFPPQPAPDNLFISKGDQSTEELFQEIKNGVWVREIIGDGTNLTTGDYSVGISGMWIENGEPAYPISEITLSGNLTEMLKNVVVGDDLLLNSRVCSPSLLLEKVTIGGV